MKHRKDDFKKVEGLLKDLYRATGEFRPPPGWSSKVMAEIYRRDISLIREDRAFAEQAVWRFAAAAVPVTLILSIYAFAAGINPDYSVIGLFLNDLFGFAVAQFFIP